ncbi:MAG: phasin family protein [Thermodesulfobacteriota bacterium]
MLDLIKKTVLASIGTAAVTKTKVQETMHYLVEQGKLTTDEAERLTREMTESGQNELSEVREQFRETIKKILQEMNVANNQDLQELQAKVENLEKRLDMKDSNKGE